MRNASIEGKPLACLLAESSSFQLLPCFKCADFPSKEFESTSCDSHTRDHNLAKCTGLEGNLESQIGDLGGGALMSANTLLQLSWEKHQHGSAHPSNKVSSWEGPLCFQICWWNCIGFLQAREVPCADHALEMRLNDLVAIWLCGSLNQPEKGT